MYTDLELAVIIILVVFVVFLVLRELVTWYWKINKLVRGQEKTNILLKRILYNQPNGRLYDEIKGEVIIEDIYTGDIKGVKKEDWQKLVSKKPKQIRYRLIKDHSLSNSDD